MAALATDRELAETWAAAAALWAAGFQAAAALIPGDGQAGRPRPPSPPRPPAPVVAPHAADRIDQLVRRVEELERRLAGFGPPPAP